MIASFKIALKSNQPREQLIEIANELKSKGLSYYEIYIVFSEFLNFAINSRTKEQEEIIRNVLDLIYGWSSSKNRMFNNNS